MPCEQPAKFSLSSAGALREPNQEHRIPSQAVGGSTSVISILSPGMSTAGAATSCRASLSRTRRWCSNWCGAAYPRSRRRASGKRNRSLQQSTLPVRGAGRYEGISSKGTLRQRDETKPGRSHEDPGNPAPVSRTKSAEALSTSTSTGRCPCTANSAVCIWTRGRRRRHRGHSGARARGP